MSSAFRQFGIYIAIAVVALSAVFFLSDFTAARRTALAESYEDSDLDLQGRRLKGYALGAEGLLADWYWIRSLQYLGNKIIKSELTNIDIEDLRPLNPRLLYPLLDNATDLDPKFIAAYTYGAVVLPAIDPSLAVKLTEKGIANNPDSWRLYQYLGYIHWRSKDYKQAAQTYERGSTVAGAPPFMREMAAAMSSQGGSRETARIVYSQIFSDASDPQSKRNAELRLMQIDSLDDRDAVNTVLADVRNRSGRCPANIQEIFPLLRNVKLPNGRNILINQKSELVDPSGVPYRLNAVECRLELATESPIPKQ